MFLSAIPFNDIYTIIPLISAVACLCCFLLINYLFLRPEKIKKNFLTGKSADAIADYATDAIANNKEQLIRSATSEESIDKIMPQIEIHIHEFLTEKVPKELPMIAMFLGEKTTHQIKEVFIKELRQLFPKVLAQYANSATDEATLKKIISEKIQGVYQMPMNAAFERNIRSYSFKLNVFSFVFGLIFGCIGSYVIYLFA